MGEMTVFVGGEGEEPVVVTDEQLDDDTGTQEEPYSVRELLDDMGLHVATYELYSVYSMFNAIWALQQVAAGDSDAHRIAKKALAEIAVSGDFEERAIEDETSPTMFVLPPMARQDYAHGSHRLDWADALNAS